MTDEERRERLLVKDPPAMSTPSPLKRREDLSKADDGESMDNPTARNHIDKSEAEAGRRWSAEQATGTLRSRVKAFVVDNACPNITVSAAQYMVDEIYGLLIRTIR
jgi:hypothetical protein